MDCLRCNIQSSLSEEMNYDNLNEEVRVHLNQTKLSQICRSKGSICNLILKDNMNNNPTPNEAEVNVSGHNNPKERSLFGIYQLLRKHFSLKDTENSHCNNNKGANFIESSMINKSALNKCNLNIRNIGNNNMDHSGSVDINESKNCENFELQEQIKTYQQIMESNNTPTTNHNMNHNIHSIQPLSYNDSQEPILQLKSLHSVIRHIRKTNSRHSAGLCQQRIEHSPLRIKKRKKEFLSSIHRHGKKRSVLNLKHKFNLRTRHQNQENNNSHNIEENDLRQIDFL